MVFPCYMPEFSNYIPKWSFPCIYLNCIASFWGDSLHGEDNLKLLLKNVPVQYILYILQVSLGFLFSHCPKHNLNLGINIITLHLPHQSRDRLVFFVVANIQIMSGTVHGKCTLKNIFQHIFSCSKERSVC